MSNLYWRLNKEEREIYDALDPSEKIKADREIEDRFYKQSDGFALAGMIARMLNGDHGDETGWFIRKMSCEHRTLQQLFTGLCLAWFKHLASLKDEYYDARNEASVKVAKDIVKLEKVQYGLPLI